MSFESLRILGVRVDKVTTEGVLRTMECFIREGCPHQVVTLNPEFVMKAQRNPEFRVTLEEADLALPDGSGLLWASRLLRQPLPERVTGSDTLPLIAQMSARRGYRLYLLGAAPGVADRAAAALIRDNPGLRIVGTYAGSPDPAQEEEIVSRITAAAPDFLFVAYGAPNQDLWIHRNLARLGVPVCMGIGGALDFIAGVAVRAPRWMRRIGLEWFHRLLCQPWRWRRMLALPKFMYLVMRQALLGAGRE